MRFETNSSEKVRITSGGDMGLGTQTPNKNSWNKASSLLKAVQIVLMKYLIMEPYEHVFALQGDDRIELINFRAGPLTFKTQNTERLRIESNGRIAIGGFSGATHDLHIKTASSPAIKLEDTTQTTILQLYAQNSNAHVGTHIVSMILY